MGYLSDRTKSKYGKRRIYFLMGALPVCLSFILLWYNFGLKTLASKVIYFLIANILFSTAFTIVMMLALVMYMASLYKINEWCYNKLMKELTYRRAHEGKSMATKKEQKIFEVITGIKF